MPVSWKEKFCKLLKQDVYTYSQDTKDKCEHDNMTSMLTSTVTFFTVWSVNLNLHLRTLQGTLFTLFYHLRQNGINQWYTLYVTLRAVLRHTHTMVVSLVSNTLYVTLRAVLRHTHKMVVSLVSNTLYVTLRAVLRHTHTMVVSLVSKIINKILGAITLLIIVLCEQSFFHCELNRIAELLFEISNRIE